MPTISITWHTMMDDRVCPICQALEGYTWVFETGKNELNGILEHPAYGDVWTLSEGSRAHGHKGNCRCSLETDFDLSDLADRVETLLATIETSLRESETA